MGRGSSSSSPRPSPPYTVFIDSNLDTHLLMMVEELDTVGDLKKKIEVEHPHCFPVGEIRVQALKVRRKSSLYHLPDSMLVKSAFNGIKRSWFLQMDTDSASPCLMKSQVSEREVESEGRKAQQGKKHLLLSSENFNPSFIEKHDIAGDIRPVRCEGSVFVDDNVVDCQTNETGKQDDALLQTEGTKIVTLDATSNCKSLALEVAKLNNEDEADTSKLPETSAVVEARSFRDKKRRSKKASSSAKDQALCVGGEHVDDASYGTPLKSIPQGCENDEPVKDRNHENDIKEADDVLLHTERTQASEGTQHLNGEFSHLGKDAVKSCEDQANLPKLVSDARTEVIVGVRDEKGKMKCKKTRGSIVESQNELLMEKEADGYVGSSTGTDEALKHRHSTDEVKEMVMFQNGKVEEVTANNQLLSLDYEANKARENEVDFLQLPLNTTSEATADVRDEKRRKKSKKNHSSAAKNSNEIQKEKKHGVRSSDLVFNSDEFLKCTHDTDESVFFQTEKTESPKRMNLGDRFLQSEQEANKGIDDAANYLKSLLQSKTEETAAAAESKVKRKSKKTSLVSDARNTGKLEMKKLNDSSAVLSPSRFERNALVGNQDVDSHLTEESKKEENNMSRKPKKMREKKVKNQFSGPLKEGKEDSAFRIECAPQNHSSGRSPLCAGGKIINDASDVNPLKSVFPSYENDELLRSSHQENEMPNVLFHMKRTEQSEKTEGMKEADKSSENEDNLLKLVTNARTELSAGVRGEKGKKKRKKTRTSMEESENKLLMKKHENGSIEPIIGSDEALKLSFAVDKIKETHSVLFQNEQAEASKSNDQLLCLDNEANKMSENEVSFRKTLSTITEATGDVRDDKRRKRSKKNHSSTAKSSDELLKEKHDVRSGDLALNCDEVLKSSHDADANVLFQTEQTETSKGANLGGPVLHSQQEANKLSNNKAKYLNSPPLSKSEETDAAGDGKEKRKSKKTYLAFDAVNVGELEMEKHGGGSIGVSPSSSERNVLVGGPGLDIHTEENNKEEDPMSRKPKKMRAKKTKLKNQISVPLLEGENGSGIRTERAAQISSSGNAVLPQIPSDILKGDRDEIPPTVNDGDGNNLANGCLDEANKSTGDPSESDKVNFRDYFLPRTDQHEFADPIEENATVGIQMRNPHDGKSDLHMQKATVRPHNTIPGSESSISSHDLPNDKHKDSHHGNKRTAKISRDSLDRPFHHNHDNFDGSSKKEYSTVKVGEGFQTSHSLPTPVVKDPSRFNDHTSGVVFDASTGYPSVTVHTNKVHKKPSELNPYHVAVRKAPSKNLGETVKNSKQENSLLDASASIFQYFSSESSQDEGELNFSQASTRSLGSSSTSSHLDQEKEEADSQILSQKIGENVEPPETGSPSAANVGRRTGHLDDNISLSQAKRSLEMVLRSSRTYKKAKKSASQPIFNDSESQSIDMVPDSLANA